MERQDQGIGADGTPAPRGPAAPGLPNDDNDAQKEKKKEREFVNALLLKKYCKHYCGGMGFCSAANTAQEAEKASTFSDEIAHNF